MLSIPLQLIKELGSRTATDEFLDDPGWTLTKALAAIHSYGVYPIFSVYVDADFESSTNNVLVVRLSLLFLISQSVKAKLPTAIAYLLL